MSAPEPGTELPPLTVDKIDPERMKAMALLLEDPNPIHVDAASVSALGLGDRTITQGPMSMGYVANALVRAFPGAVVEHLNLRFRSNVFAGDTVRVNAQVVRADLLDDGASRVQCTVALDVEGSGTALEGTAVVRVPSNS